MSFGFGFGFPKSDTVADGGVPGGGASLRLNFLDSTTLDPRVTFSRTSNATVFDNAGNLIYAPHNFLTNSESFDNSIWTASSSNVVVTANTAVAPDNTRTADTLTFTAASSFRYQLYNPAVNLTGRVFVFSVWLASVTKSRVAIRIAGSTTGTGGQILLTLTPTLTRYSVAVTIPSGNTAILAGFENRDFLGGDGLTGEILVWGAQLNAADAPGVNLLTFSEQFDNAAWTKTNSSVQSNLVTYSQELDNAAWTKLRAFIQTNQIRNNTMQGAVAGTPGTLPTNWSVSGTATSSVIGTGTENGISYIDVRFQGAGAADAFNLFFDGVTQIAALNGQSWAGSFYLKLVGGSVANLSLIQRLAFRNSGGANIQSVDTSSLVPTSAALNTQRTTLSLTAAQATTAFVTTALNSGTPTGAFDLTLRIGWPQLVQGAVAGDPVPTYGAARAVMYPAPDGSITADKLCEDTSPGTTHFARLDVSVLAGAQYTKSIYFKAVERDQIELAFDVDLGTFGGATVLFTASGAGTATVTAGSPLGYGITAVGNGWYRCWVISAALLSGTFVNRYRMASGGTSSYNGDGTSGVLIWGAQLVQGSEPYDYVRTDATPVAIGYGAPDGTFTADLLTATASPFARVIQNVALSVGTYTLSIYAKADTALFLGGTVEIAGQVLRVYGNLTTGATNQTTDAGTISATSSSENVGSGWWRFQWTISVPTSATYTLYFAATDSFGSFNVTVGRSILIWGAQLNLGATALPYVETENNIYPVPSYNDTTVQNLLGYTQEFDNAAWTKTNSYIQTNLLAYSEQFDNAAWTKSASYIQTNLLTYSQEFDNAAFGKTAGTVTANAGAAPDGTLTADQIASTGGGAFRASIAVTLNVLHTASVYAKAVSGGGVFSFGFDANPANGRASFNLSTGAVSSIGANVVSASAEALADGWYRCIVSAITTSTTCNLVYYNSTSGANWLVWGAQLVQGSDPGDYQVTYGGTSVVGYLAPDGSSTADKLVETTAASGHEIFQGAVTIGVTYAVSLYAKAVERNKIAIQGLGLGGAGFTCLFDLVSGTVSNAPAGSQIVPSGNGWYRCSVPFTATSTNGPILRLADAAGNQSYTGDGTSGALFWGAQLVQGSIPGDYQETIATALPVQYVAPDGSVTADKIVPTTTSASHSITAGAGTAVSGSVYTLSVYAKAAEYGFIRLSFGNTAGGGLTFFNLNTGTIGTTSGMLANQIQSVGNGWYRCSVSRAAVASASINGDIFINSADNQFSWAGDGTSGIFIWGAQLSDSASLDPYVYNPVAAPTAAAYYGPRFDYDPATLAARGLLIEEQRTNSIRNNTMQGAVAGTPGTLPTNWAVSGLGTLTREVVGTGTVNGITYIDIRFSGTTSTTQVSVRFEPSNAVSGTNGQTFTFSSWAARVAGSTSNIGDISANANIFDAGSVFLASLVFAGYPVTAPTTLARASGTGTIASASAAFIQPQIYINFASGVAIDITLRIGMPQLEQGPNVTSVIPTTTAAATRTTDFVSMLGANFTNWYSQPEGTMFVVGSVALPVSGTNQFMTRASDNSYNNGNGILASTAGILQISTSAGGVFDGLAGNFVALPNVTFKTAGAYKTNDLGISSNGGTVATDPTATIPLNMTRMDLGGDHAGFNRIRAGYIRQITYFPRRLANAELQGVTL